MTPTDIQRLKLENAERLAVALVNEAKATEDRATRRLILAQLTHAQRLVDAVKVEIEAQAARWAAGDLN
jgi:hypothetical protein